MGKLCGGLGRFSVSRGKGSGWLVTPLLIAAIFLVTNAPAFAEPPVQRAVLGTVVAAGALEVALEQGMWKPAEAGSAVLEETELRTQGGTDSLVALGSLGLIGFSEKSHVHIGRITQAGLPISLRGESEMSFRIPTTTAISFLTNSAVVKGPAGQGMPTDGDFIQGVIAQRDKETTVTVVEGDLLVRNSDAAEFVAIGSGEQVVVADRSEAPRPVVLAQEGKATTQRRLMPGFLNTTKGKLIAGGTLVAIGGGIGIAAAASGGDGDDDERPASPHKP